MQERYEGGIGVVLWLKSPINGRKVLKGMSLEIGEDFVRIFCNAHDGYAIPWHNVAGWKNIVPKE